MKICGLVKVSLLDYPNLIAGTIFTRGCNFSCPYCQNAGLVIPSLYDPLIDTNEVLKYFKKRANVLDGVVVSGGEPTLQPDLIPFIKELKSYGLKVKLDTNGFNLLVIKELVESKLVDYIAIDIKNSLAKYSLTTNTKNLDTSKLIETIEYLKTTKLDYEYRTTFVDELHTIDDCKEIANLIKGVPHYYLQNYRDSKNTITKGLHPCSKEKLLSFQKVFLDLGIDAELRGIE